MIKDSIDFIETTSEVSKMILKLIFITVLVIETVKIHKKLKELKR